MKLFRRSDAEEKERGAVIPLVALALVFLMTTTAFTIDLGRVMLRNRDLQSVSDLVALDLSRRLSDRSVDEINADTTFRQQMFTSAARNSFPAGGSRTIDYELGFIDIYRQFHRLSGSSHPNAVRVISGDTINYFFTPGSHDASRATAVMGPATPICVAPDVKCPILPLPPDAGGQGATTTTTTGGGGTTTTTAPGGSTTTTTAPGGSTTSTTGGGTTTTTTPGTTTTTTGGGTTTTTIPGCPPPTCFPALTAATTDFEVGSFLAGVSLNSTHSKLLNALFSTVGTGVNLDVVSYQGLAASQLTLRQLATEMGFGSPDDLFTGTVSYKQFLLGSAQALSKNGGTVAAVNALNTLGASVASTTRIDMNRIIARGTGFYLGQGNDGSAFDTYIKLFNLLEGSAFVVNGSNTVSVPGLSFGIPGITNVDATLSVIEPVQRRYRARVGESLSTSQVNLTLTVTIDLDLGGRRAGERLKGTLVIHPQGASATATPTLIVCPNPSGVPPRVQIGVVSSPVTTTGHAALTLSAQVGVVVVDVMSVNVPGASILSGGSTSIANFNYPSEFLPSVGSGSMKRVGNPSLNLASGFSATTSNSTLIGLPPIPLATLVGDANFGLSTSLFASVQDTIVPSIMGTLGVELGGADVGVSGISCGVPIIVK